MVTKRKGRKPIRKMLDPMSAKLKPQQLDILYVISQLKEGLMNYKHKAIKEALVARGFAKVHFINFCLSTPTPFLKITKLGKKYIEQWKAKKLAEIEQSSGTDAVEPSRSEL